MLAISCSFARISNRVHVKLGITSSAMKATRALLFPHRTLCALYYIVFKHAWQYCTDSGCQSVESPGHQWWASPWWAGIRCVECYTIMALPLLRVALLQTLYIA